MNPAISDLSILLRTMAPELNAGEYVFATVDDPLALPARELVACIREAEGLSVVLAASVAQGLGMATEQRFAWITLKVHSDLQAVGLTAAFSSALAREGIGCNVAAGHLHDHIFVPLAQRGAAMAAPGASQRSVRQGSAPVA